MFKLGGIAPARRGVPQIEVKFDIDANGILKVSAKDKATGKEQSITIQGTTSLSDEEIKRMKDEAAANLKADEKEKERVEKLNKADSVIFQTESQIKEFDDKLSEDDKKSLTEALDKLKETHKSEKIDDIDKDIDNLNDVWNTVSSKMYAQNESAQTDVHEENNQDQNNVSDDDVEDVDFEEVK
jgi:molecular chaperone DnaK